ncbi:paralemmin-3 [Eucyclogobius newberryi]|uniref:paralemmin-3 n=1 Tax=Eucyclogobius newberryi TaxID=166745 RepID=UPI003B5C05F4
MDEAEKYQQRLEAIAEKRRLLEEQERAKREMEDERIRLQQLKRKSLRDQWLMEGPPLSPSSLDAAAPRSPLWGTQAQEIEKHIEKLESQTQQLAEAEEKLTEEMEDGQIETAAIEETATAIVQNILHNGKNGTESGDAVQAAVLTNGAGGTDEDTVHAASAEAPPTSNGLSEEMEPGRVNLNNNNVGGNEYAVEEEGTIVIRAECVMITDEGDDTAEDVSKEDRWENATSLLSEETQKTVTEYGQNDGTAATAVESAMIPNGVEEDHWAEATAAQEQAQTQEGAAVAPVAPVPVYSDAQPRVTTTQVDAEIEGVAKEEETIEVASKAKGNVKVEFQEVPLSEPPGKATPGEQAPLLSQVKATDAGKAGTSTQTESPSRADQAETKMPKQKTCQCCSVM